MPKLFIVSLFKKMQVQIVLKNSNDSVDEEIITNIHYQITNMNCCIYALFLKKNLMSNDIK